MSDPKSMERLYARFESFRDKHPVGLLYSLWCDDIEPLSVEDLPTTFNAWKGQYPNFSFSPAAGHQGLMVPGSKDRLTKDNVLEACRSAAKTLHNELDDHGLDPHPPTNNPEINWLWALVQAAGNGNLGFDGFEDSERLVAFKDKECVVGESMLWNDDFEWCDDNLLPRAYMRIPNIVEASLILLDHLSNEPETKPDPKPKRSGKVHVDEVLDTLAENEPVWCMLHDIDEIAARSGFSESNISGNSDVYKHKIKPMQEKAGTFKKNKKKLRTALESGDVALLNENQRASYDYLKSFSEDNGFDEDDDL